jgi:hypothetical protein
MEIKPPSEENIYADQCFDDFFPRSNKKYKLFHQDIKSIPSYDLNAYKNLYDAFYWILYEKDKRDYCKRKCYNQRFSPNKYNENTNKYPEIEDLVEFIELMDKDPTTEKSNCIFIIENKEVLKKKNIVNVRENIDVYLKLHPGKPLPKTYEELIFMNASLKGLDMNAPIKNDFQILYNGKEGKLIVPLSQESSLKLKIF